MAIALKPESIACGLIQIQQDSSLLKIKSFEHTQLNNFELEHQIIFNSTRLGKHIQEFFTKHKIAHTPVRISLQGPSIVEKFITLSDTDLSSEIIKIPELDHIVWEETLIAQQADYTTHYLCGISRHILFQYKLLAIKLKLNLECISTHTLSLLSTYSALHQSSSTELPHCNFSIEKMMEGISLQPIVPNITTDQDSLIMAELIGLSVAGLTYENF